MSYATLPGPGDLAAPPADDPVCELCGQGPTVDGRYCDTCRDRLDTPIEALVVELAERDDERRMAQRMRDLLADVHARRDVSLRDVWQLVDEWDCHLGRLREVASDG